MTTRHDMTIRRTAALAGVALLLAACVQPAGAVPQIESTYGGQGAWYSAEMNGMAATGAAAYRGGLSTILNPAGLAAAHGLRLDVGLAADHHEEDRFQPLYDSFQSLVDDIAIASNQNTWWNTGFALSGRLAAQPLPVSFGLSLADRYPYSYRFEEEIRDPDTFADPRDRILEERVYEVTGVLRQISGGLAVEPVPGLSVGAALHYAFGERGELWRVRDNDLADGDQSYENSNTWSLDGVGATIGVQYQVHERVRLGLAYETELEVEGDLDTSAFAAGDTVPTVGGRIESLTYPAHWRFGAAFYPRSDPRTAFLVDVVYADWTELEDSRADSPATFMQEVLDVRIGLQHTFYNATDLRFGFRRYDSYADDDGGVSVWSGGVGFPVVGGQMSVSLELSKQQSVLPHIYEYPTDYVVEETARVDDLRYRVGLGWSREF